MPATITPAALLDALHWRYATKAFDPTKKIPTELWHALEQSLVLAPSSFGLQPWKFIVITDQTMKDTLPPLSWNQRQPAEASHMVVFAVQTKPDTGDVQKFMERIATVRGVPLESLDGYKNIINGFITNPTFDTDAWAAKQVYIALGQFMAAAAVLGIDTCPMEGVDPAAYDGVLGLTNTGYRTLVACPAGYRAADDKYASLPKVRFDTNDVVTYI